MRAKATERASADNHTANLALCTLEKDTRPKISRETFVLLLYRSYARTHQYSVSKKIMHSVEMVNHMTKPQKKNPRFTTGGIAMSAGTEP